MFRLAHAVAISTATVLSLATVSAAFAQGAGKQAPPPDPDKQLIGQAAQAMRKGDKPGAKKILAKVSAGSPQYAKALELQARIALEENNYVEVFRRAKESLRLQDIDKMEHGMRTGMFYNFFAAVGNWYRSKKDDDTAYEAYIIARALNPRGPRAGKMWATYTTQWLEAKEFDRIIKNTAAALKVLPDQPSLLYSMGLALKGKGDLDAALKTFLKCTDREDGEAFVEAARIMVEQGKRMDAKKLLEDALNRPFVKSSANVTKLIQQELETLKG